MRVNRTVKNMAAFSAVHLSPAKSYEDLAQGDVFANACEVRNGRAIEKTLNKRIFLNKWKK